MEEKYLIEKVGKENPFRVPEGYFDTLTSQIMAKVEAEGVEARDIKTGKEKRAAQTMMVQAIDLRDAVKNLDKGMAGTLGDYVIVSVAETKIMDVFRYKVAEGEEA